MTPSSGQQLMQTKVGGEVRRFLFTLLTENNSNGEMALYCLYVFVICCYHHENKITEISVLFQSRLQFKVQMKSVWILHHFINDCNRYRSINTRLQVFVELWTTADNQQTWNVCSQIKIHCGEAGTLHLIIIVSLNYSKRLFFQHGIPQTDLIDAGKIR